jgi:hypothetical protein
MSSSCPPTAGEAGAGRDRPSFVLLSRHRAPVRHVSLVPFAAAGSRQEPRAGPDTLVPRPNSLEVSSTSLLDNQLPYLRDLGVVCSGDALITSGELWALLSLACSRTPCKCSPPRIPLTSTAPAHENLCRRPCAEVDTTVPASSSTVPFRTVECAAGIGRVTGRTQALSQLPAAPGALLSVDALCYDTLGHTSQLNYVGTVPVRLWQGGLQATCSVVGFLTPVRRACGRCTEEGGLHVPLFARRSRGKRRSRRAAPPARLRRGCRCSARS